MELYIKVKGKMHKFVPNDSYSSCGKCSIADEDLCDNSICSGMSNILECEDGIFVEDTPAFCIPCSC